MLMRVPGIKRVTVRRRGKVYVYYRHRATGRTIKAQFGTAEFAAEAAQLDARARSKTVLPGSLGGLVNLYRAAPEFLNLAARTSKDYERVFLYLKPLDDMPLLEIDTRFVYGLRDKAFARHKRRFSTYVVQVLRIVLEWGRVRNYLASNPAAGIRAIRRPKAARRANRAWTDAEREAVLEAAPKALRTAIAIGMFAGLREGDAIRLPWSACNRNVIASVAAKTGEPLWIPVHFRLRRILEVTDRESPVIAVNSYGTPWTESGFRASFFKLLKKLEKAGKIGPKLTYHGLRHTVGKLIIDAGGDTRDVGAILGHASEISSAHYSREADRQKRAAATVKRLERTERRKMDKQADNPSAVSASRKS